MMGVMQDATHPYPAELDGGMPDPRPRRREWPLVVLALVLLGVVAFMQRPGEPDPLAAREAKSGKLVDPVGVNPLVGIGKASLWLKGQLSNAGDANGAKDLIRIGDDYARSAADRFRMAVLAGELDGWKERESRFEKLEAKLDPDSPLRADIATVRAVKFAGGEEGPAPAEPAAKEGLKERHGWFARLVLAGEDPAEDSALERETARDGEVLVAVLGLFMLVFFAALVAGVVILILLTIRAATGKLHSGLSMAPGAAAGDRALWLETFSVFLLGFLAVKGAAAGLEQVVGNKQWLAVATLLMQWSLIGVVFWPRLRGMPAEQFRQELGWHRGKGVMQEISAGIMGYLAGLPIYICTAIVVVVVSVLIEMIRKGMQGVPGDDLPVPDNKVLDMVSGASGITLLLLAGLIVIWAPLVEESIFRGALYRHIRARLGGFLGMVAAVGLVAAAFALAHAYVMAGVIMVATLGAIFALMREWRGSLIAPMTAHFLHNGTILLLLLSILPLMRG